MHYSPFIPIEITSNFDKSYGKTAASRKQKRNRDKREGGRASRDARLLEAELADKRAQIAATDYQLTAIFKEATERLVDDVFSTREAQQRAIERESAKTNQLEKQKQELAEQKRLLAEQKRSLASRNDVLQARTSRQEEELRKLKEQLAEAKKAERAATTKAEKAAKKTRPSIRGLLGNLLGEPPQLDKDGPASMPKILPPGRILDLD